MSEEKERGLVVYESRDGQEIRLSFDTVRKYLVSGKPEYVTDQEIVLYMGTCKARGLNPFKKDCYLVKYTENDPAATIVAIDFYRSRARAQPDCVGWKAGILLHSEKGGLEYREGSFIMPGENLVGGWFKARPASWREEYTWTISVNPFVKRNREGKITQFWREENQAYMIHKVVESQGLHRLWPDEFQGLQLDDEFNALRDVSEQREPLRTPQALSPHPGGDPSITKGKPDERKPEAPSGDRLAEKSDGGRRTDTRIPEARRTKPTPTKTAKQADKPADTAGDNLPRTAVEKPMEIVENFINENPSEKSQEDIIAECLLWIEQSPVDQLNADDNWLMNQVKHLKGIENQLKVLRPFNNRRQELAKQ